MNRINSIISLSKKIASAILNEKDISSKLKNDFPEDDTKAIIEELTNPYLRRKRDEKLTYLNNYKDQDWAKIKPKSYKSKTSFSHYYKFAAVFLILITCGFFYFNTFNTPNTSTRQNPVATLPYSDVIFNDGSGVSHVISESSNRTFEPLVKTNNGFTLDYTQTNTSIPTNRLVYNEITVPYGRNFQIILHDGSKVTLNAGSSLKYPIEFIKGKNREVFLTGEAFFEVEKNTNSPFIVNANDIEVTVLGTKFNVSNYPEDSKIKTVLVEGSIALNTTQNKNTTENIILKPEQKAIYSKKDKSIAVSNAKVDLYTSWMTGKVVFEHMPFKNIAKKLERHYNVKISNRNDLLGEEKFTASFDVESMEQVLTSFKTSYDFNFNIKNNIITIN